MKNNTSEKTPKTIDDPVEAALVKKVKRKTLILKGYRLTTAEILYRMPDYPSFLQTFVWQDLDLAPRFPILMKFLDFWENNLEGPLHSVRVGSTSILSPKETQYADVQLTLH
ncbi:MAG: Usg family protein [Pricia sp.]|nr:Usg family protein [Pricia sp.]